jgi:hypothetical protein
MYFLATGDSLLVFEKQTPHVGLIVMEKGFLYTIYKKRPFEDLLIGPLRPLHWTNHFQVSHGVL